MSIYSKLRYLPVVILFSLQSYYISANEDPLDDPVTSPIEFSQKEENFTSAKNSTTATDQSKNNITSITDNIPKFQQTEPQKSNINQNNETTQTSDRWDWDFIFSLLLVVFNGVLAVSTIALWRSTRNTADAASTSAKAALKTLSVTHRPRLIVRCINYIEDNGIIEYEITNIGESAAEVIRIQDFINPEGERSEFVTYSNEPNINSFLIHAGEVKKWRIDINDNTRGDIDFLIGFCSQPGNESPSRIFHLVGYIVYKDTSIGIHHRTAFLRIYVLDKKRFVPMANPDPDYEHAD